jgi:hypothetical protein
MERATIVCGARDLKSLATLVRPLAKASRRADRADRLPYALAFTGVSR